MKVEKSILTPKWQEIKAMYENGTNGSNEYGKNFPIDGELDELTQHFIGMLGAITLKQGFDTIVEGVKMDLWKERIWSVVENAGLLPEIAWKDELEMENIRDSWSDTDSEFDIDEISDEQIYNQLTNG